MKTLWDYISSLKLTVYLCLAITALTMYGSMVLYFNQDVFGDMDQSLLFPWLLGKGLQYPGLSWWLYVDVVLVVLLGINTFACTVDRVPGMYRRYVDQSLNLRDIALDGPAGRKVELGEDGLESITRGLAGRGYRVHVDGNRLYGEKRGLIPFVPYVVHVGMMLFMVAHLISGNTGYRNPNLFAMEGMPVMGQDGGPFSLTEGGWTIRADRLYKELREDGSVKDYGGEITILMDGKEIDSGVTRANTPMFTQGAAIYLRHADSQFGGLLLDAKTASTGFSGRLSVNQQQPAARIPDTGYVVSVEAFIPDFGLDESGRPKQLSDNLSNPALYASLYSDNRPVGGGWLIQNDPSGNTFRHPDVTLSFAGIDMQTFAVFEVNRDPGAILAFIASMLVMIGSLVTLVMRRERFWACADVSGRYAQVMGTDDKIVDRLF